MLPDGDVRRGHDLGSAEILEFFWAAGHGVSRLGIIGKIFLWIKESFRKGKKFFALKKEF
jgi:hypothetical protein